MCDPRSAAKPHGGAGHGGLVPWRLPGLRRGAGRGGGGVAGATGCRGGAAAAGGGRSWGCWGWGGWGWLVGGLGGGMVPVFRIGFRFFRVGIGFLMPWWQSCSSFWQYSPLMGQVLMHWRGQNWHDVPGEHVQKMTLWPHITAHGFRTRGLVQSPAWPGVAGWVPGPATVGKVN